MDDNTLLAAFSTFAVMAASFDYPRIRFPFSYRKVGGIHFVRLGFLRFSFCIARY